MQVHCAEEAADFQRVASALLLNVGTLSPDWVAGMVAAVSAANELKKPWVLDPVAAGATPFRTEVRSPNEVAYAESHCLGALAQTATFSRSQLLSSSIVWGC